MSIITLLSDYGNKGSKVSKAKALLLSEISTINLVDVSHEISPFNIVEAAYITKRSYINYPRGTIHIIDVDAQYNPEKYLIISYYDNIISSKNKIITGMIIGINVKFWIIFNIK